MMGSTSIGFPRFSKAKARVGGLAQIFPRALAEARSAASPSGSTSTAATTSSRGGMHESPSAARLPPPPEWKNAKAQKPETNPIRETAVLPLLRLKTTNSCLLFNTSILLPLEPIPRNPF